MLADEVPAPELPRLYTVQELARYAGVATSVVTHHCRAAWLSDDAVHSAGRWLIPEDAGREFVARMIARRAEIARRLT